VKEREDEMERRTWGDREKEREGKRDREGV
jgi:hypothetical protein